MTSRSEASNADSAFPFDLDNAHLRRPQRLPDDDVDLGRLPWDKREAKPSALERLRGPAEQLLGGRVGEPHDAVTVEHQHSSTLLSDYRAQTLLRWRRAGRRCSDPWVPLAHRPPPACAPSVLSVESVTCASPARIPRTP